MDYTEKTVSSREIYNGRIIHVKEDTVQLPDGKLAGRELVIHHGGVGVIAVDEDKNVLTVTQYRKPYDEMVLEVPAGKLEPGEDPKSAGIRELQEETGYQAKNVEYIGKYYPTPGYCSEIISLYLATDLTFVGQNLDEGEFVEVKKIPISTLVEMVMNNEIYDAKTAIAILKADKILN
ncbi:MAG: NUDIX hydrolase [Ruminococcaceae bacterium]|nr:NUDIX hydrolase [Oscillospiraceae bacterium]